jgi:hypothetical protein
MLIPFNGGSGPMGFYVSFLFIALVFLISFVIMIAGIFKPTWRQSALAILICLGLTYSLIFTEEYVFGKISGSASEVLRSSLTYVKADKSGDQYITYNDIGAYELSAMHKYAGRFYVAPELEGTNLERLGKFNGKYLIVDMPRIDTNSGYAIFFKSCTVLASSTSGQIKGYIYSCNRQAQ